MEEPKKVIKVTAVRLPSAELPPLAAPPAFPLAIQKAMPPVVRPSGQSPLGPMARRPPIPATLATPRPVPGSSISARAFPTTAELLGQVGTFEPDCLAADEVADHESIGELGDTEDWDAPDDDADLDLGEGGDDGYGGFEEDGWGGGGGNSHPLLAGKPQHLLEDEDGDAGNKRRRPLLEGPKTTSKNHLQQLPGKGRKPTALPWMPAGDEGER